ncbi:MAG: hypothetical protein KGY66_07430 [Candidatus Thermoplasmatota archaeon]|nr:hypothetical protein [Candidatus Thermoplasmatota archaeon]MBS3790730.1 hypothetical protein [Candidatus Thermoplasmatota archaeon]
MAEKVMKEIELDKVVLSASLMIVSLLASLTSYNLQGWWFPLISGFIAIIGLTMKREALIDLGVLASSSSFFYFIHDIPFSYRSLFLLLAMFFLYFGIWSFMRRSITISEIEKDLVRDEGRNFLEEYQEHSAMYYLWSMLLSFLIASIGSVVAIYSYVGPFPSEWAIILFLLFSGGVMLAVYTVVFILPGYFSRKEMPDEEESGI